MDTIEILLQPEDNQRLANLCGQFNENLKQIERRLGIQLSNRGHAFSLSGDPSQITVASQLLKSLYAVAADKALSPEQVHLRLQESSLQVSTISGVANEEMYISTRKTRIECRGINQQAYLRSMREHDLTFGVGPAGTGKTYLAVAAAVEMLEKQQVRRLVLVRPAVEAGERLGFLPGDMAQKVDPYLRPIYDALYEFMGMDKVAKLIEKNIIEIAPLAFMRGRTLNQAAIIMDEAQNTTVEQMKMFLTRIGFGATAIVTGDPTQIDLPNKTRSGLVHVLNILEDIEGIGISHFEAKDVVRHPIVQTIITAFDQAENNDRRRDH